VSKPTSGPRAKPSDDVEPLSFEAALAQIESIIERIESGEVGLEESLREYERGVSLINHCSGKLDRAQQQVEDLTRRLKESDEVGGSPPPASSSPGSATGGEPPF
jgi:exodeoxyribonuclease VII small subunit